MLKSTEYSLDTAAQSPTAVFPPHTSTKRLPGCPSQGGLPRSRTLGATQPTPQESTTPAQQPAASAPVLGLGVGVPLGRAVSTHMPQPLRREAGQQRPWESCRGDSGGQQAPVAWGECTGGARGGEKEGGVQCYRGGRDRGTTPHVGTWTRSDFMNAYMQVCVLCIFAMHGS